MSDADQVALRFVRESTFGTTPGSPDLINLRHTGESLRENTEYSQSAEIRNDRQVAVVKRTNIGALGAINFEYSYAAYDDMTLAVLQDTNSTWPSETTDTDTVYSAVNATNTINRSTGSFVSDGFTQYSWIKIAGFTESANNGYFKIAAITATDLTLTGGTLTDEAAGDSVTITQGGPVVNGTTQISYAIEKEFADLSNEFAMYNGMTPDIMRLNVTHGAIITGSLEFVGTTETSATATVDGTPTAAPTNDIMNAIDDVTSILEGQSSYSASEFTLQVANGLRARGIIGTLGADSLGAGPCVVTGTLNAYYSSKTIADKYLNATETSMAIVMEDTDGNATIWDMPRVRFTQGARSAEAQNTDVMIPLNWSAYRHASEGVTVRVTKIAA